MTIIIDYPGTDNLATRVSEINSRVSAILNDGDAERMRWPLEERMDWINDAVSEIALVRPAAVARTARATLKYGAHQELPEDGLALFDVVRNITADGKPGRAITRTDRHLLDSAEPDWYGRKPSSVVRHYTSDDRDPKSFYVYPPAEIGTQVEIFVAVVPARVSSLDADLAIDRTYISPIVSFVVYRALAKDSEYANGVVAAAHLQAFNEAIGARNEVSLAVGPKGELNERP